MGPTHVREECKLQDKYGKFLGRANFAWRWVTLNVISIKKLMYSGTWLKILMAFPGETWGFKQELQVLQSCTSTQPVSGPISLPALRFGLGRRFWEAFP